MVLKLDSLLEILLYSIKLHTDSKRSPGGLNVQALENIHVLIMLSEWKFNQTDILYMHSFGEKMNVMKLCKRIRKYWIYNGLKLSSIPWSWSDNIEMVQRDSKRARQDTQISPCRWNTFIYLLMTSYNYTRTDPQGFIN